MRGWAIYLEESRHNIYLDMTEFVCRRRFKLGHDMVHIWDYDKVFGTIDDLCRIMTRFMLGHVI